MEKVKFEKVLHELNNYFGTAEFASEAVYEDVYEDDYNGQSDIYYFDPTSYTYDESTNTSRHVAVLVTPPQENTPTMEECGMDSLNMCIDSFIDTIKEGLAQSSNKYTIIDDDIDVYDGWNKDDDMWHIEVHFTIRHDV